VRTDGSVVRTQAAAAAIDEPLARGHAWGEATRGAKPASVAVPADRVARLSSRVLGEDLCAERFRHLAAVAVGARAWEFEFEVSSPVGFVSMPRQVPTERPVVVRIELSAAAREGSGADPRRQIVRFSINGGAAHGTCALAFDLGR
jgi:hypothetical protein